MFSAVSDRVQLKLLCVLSFVVAHDEFFLLLII